MTEALAAYAHHRIRGELGIAGDTGIPIGQGYRGARYSFGFPACPNLADQEKLLDLLDGGRLGITLGEHSQMHPEQSTSALIVHHPQARNFNV